MIKTQRKWRWRWVFLAALVLGAYLALQAFWFVPRSLTVREIAIQSPEWRGPPLKIALVSDIHGDEFHMPVSRIKAIAADVTALKPDIVLLGGDYVGGHFRKSGLPGAASINRTKAENMAEADTLLALENFSAPLGVFAVMGNHDCWWDCAQVRSLIGLAGVRLLENKAKKIQRPNGSFWVVGLEDGQTQNPDFSVATEGIPVDADVLTLVHNPGLFRWPSNKAAFQFSGHSHGGQVRFPFIGAPVRMSRYTEETVNQPLVKDGRILVVTTGVGTVGLPVRFGVPPEIVLLKLSSSPNVAIAAKSRRPIQKAMH